VHVDLPKLPIKQFKPVFQSRQQALRAYCPNKHTVVFCNTSFPSVSRIFCSHKLTSLFFFFTFQRQREAAELALNGGEGQAQQMQEPEEEM
jgi:hypothetical protein